MTMKRITIYRNQLVFAESGVHNIGMFGFDDLIVGNLYRLTLTDNCIVGYVMDIADEKLILETE